MSGGGVLESISGSARRGVRALAPETGRLIQED